MNFEDVVVNGVPLLALIIGLVTFAKSMGLAGRALQALSACLGLALGIAYQVSLGVPADFSGWLGVVVYGLGLGVVASGLVDTARDLAERASGNK
jgi:hypothetical protein